MSVFTETRSESQLFETEHFWVRRDAFPVSLGHTLIISKREVPTYFDLTDREKIDLIKAIQWTKEELDAAIAPDGYNIGMNCGEAAGQTVNHFHCHIICRFKGDCDDPRGGVRHCIPGKGYY